MNRRTGVDGEEFGITFSLAMPDRWNGDLLMQGGGGSNGIVLAPLGLNAAGDTPGLIRGFAVVSTDSGHQSRHPGFDFGFMRDQQAYLDFAYLANAEIAALAKQLIAQHYGKPAAFSYFSGCSTGGREGMILSQRYPTIFNGIISGDPAMRTGLSNLSIGRWIPIALNQVAPKDANAKPIIEQSITDNDRKLISNALSKQCDAKDGIADGLISDPLACDFDPEMLACKGEGNISCLAPEKAAAIKKALGGPKTSTGTQVYAGFLYDTGITNGPPFRGLLSPGPGIFGPATTDMTMDVDTEALAASQPLVDSMSTNLTTFSAHGGKLIFYHGDSDPWFSPLDTFVGSPVILVGHSYGGATITAAGVDDRVAGLVYIGAVAPEVGETVQDQLNKYPSDIFSRVEVVDGYAWMLPNGTEFFCGDLSEQEQKFVWATHFPPVADLFQQQQIQSTPWKSKPSWYILCLQDHTVHPDLQRWVSNRMGATVVEVESSHVPMLSKPDVVIEVIRKAAAAVQKSKAA
ncbi:MAG TPA: alpha/beta hydrolase family protein [Candidatus Sulfotelmatobacter sp.]|jgi:hypothetical protein